MPQSIIRNTPRAVDRGPSPRTRFWGPRGSALLYVIAAIALLGALGGGVAYFSSSSSMSDIAKMAHTTRHITRRSLDCALQETDYQRMASKPLKTAR